MLKNSLDVIGWNVDVSMNFVTNVGENDKFVEMKVNVKIEEHMMLIDDQFNL